MRLLFGLFGFAQQKRPQLLTCECFDLMSLFLLLVNYFIVFSDPAFVILDIFMQFVGLSLQFLILVDDMFVVGIVIG